jgi:hypothetical protein
MFIKEQLAHGVNPLQGASWLTGTLLATSQIVIFAYAELDVCEGRHPANVMKKVKGPAQAELGRTTRPDSNQNS